MSKLPPVPPGNHSTKDPQAETDVKGKGMHPYSKEEINPEEQGQSANIRQNTTNQGYQQDR